MQVQRNLLRLHKTLYLCNMQHQSIKGIFFSMKIFSVEKYSPICGWTAETDFDHSSHLIRY